MQLRTTKESFEHSGFKEQVTVVIKFRIEKKNLPKATREYRKVIHRETVSEIQKALQLLRWRILFLL